MRTSDQGSGRVRTSDRGGGTVRESDRGSGTVRESDRGSGTLAMIVITLVVAVGLLIGSMVLAYVLALHKVRGASDMAALTAATHAVQGSGEDQACDQARRIASDNGAQLTSCEVQQAGAEVAASVETTIALTWSFPGLPDHVSSISYAGNP